MKKVISWLVALTTIMAMFVMPVSAADETLTVGQPVYTVGGANVPIPQNGDLQIAIPLTGSGNATLFAVTFDKTTGRFLNCVTDTKAAGETLSVTVSGLNLATTTLKILVWNSKDGMVPYDVPADDALYLTAKAKAGAVTLQWYATDGVTTGTYDVYRDGEVLTTVNAKGGYIDYGVSGGHTYQVKSGTRESKAVTANAGMSFTEAASKAILSTQKGTFDVKCYKDDGTLIDFTKNYKAGSATANTHWANRYGSAIFIPNIDIEETGITLYVVGFKNTGSVHFATGGGVPQAVNKLQGTLDSSYPLNAQWGSVVGHDYVMRGDYPALTVKKGEMVCDFRAADDNGNYYIKDVYAFKTSDVTTEIDAAMRSIGASDTTYPNGVSISVNDSKAVLNGMWILENSGGDNHFEYGTDHIVLGTTRNGANTMDVAMKPRMKVSDEYIYGSEPVMLEIEYSTEDADKITFQWFDENGKGTGVNINLVKDGERHTAYVVVDKNAYFANSFESKYDLCMYGEIGKTIKLYSLTIKNANHFPVKAYSM